MKADERAAFGLREGDPDTYAVLIPFDTHARTLKAIDQDTALMYLTLQEPGPLPSSMRTALGDGLAATVAGLVFDGILEVRQGDRFVSGPEASPLFNLDTDSVLGRGRLAQLSVDALRYAQHLEVDDVRTLATRLYAYNRHVLTPAWARQLATREATAHHLGLSEGGSPPGPAWVAVDHAADTSWLAWRSARTVDRNRETVGYKLYVSPDPSAVADALAITAEVVHARGAHAFKVGADVHGLLRPDKLVVYFSSFEDLSASATCLTERLVGFPAHGVPFTAEITADGLLSWGVDPPRRQQGLSWTGESWRLWVVGRLAAALLSARSVATITEPWRYALERVALEGLDATTWVPSQTLFAA